MPSARSATSPFTAGRILPCLLFTGIYALLLLWFHAVDVYHRHFTTIGPLVLAYNMFRVLFIFYLFWMVHAAGTLMLRAVAASALRRLGAPERMALGFFAGTGVWHVAMLLLGYLNLYSPLVAALITVPLVAWSYGNFASIASELSRELADRDAQRRNLGEGWARWLILALAVAAFVLLLLIKGLFPNGGHDYFTHYFYYYTTVTERGGLWPNEVWYHYYYSKGAGLYFLAILLTDPLAPQLVTFCFIAVAALALFLFLRRIAPASQWPMLGIVLFLALQLYTPGSTTMFSSQGGWGNFEKLHELNAALIIAIVWMTSEALDSVGKERRLWSAGVLSASTAAIIINITVAVFLGAMFGLLAAWNLLKRSRARSFLCAGFAAAAALMLLLTLLVNQLTTGLASDQGILHFWRFANLGKLYDWGALPLAMIIHHGTTGMVAASVPLAFGSLRLLIEASRSELLLPLIVPGVIVWLARGLSSRLWRWRSPQTSVLAACIMVFIALALTVGRAQPISFYRYSSFVLPITISAAILLWSIAAAGGSSWPARFARHRHTPIAVLLACLLLALYPRQTGLLLAQSARFVVGASSIDMAYGVQFGPDPHFNKSAIHPGARGAHDAAGPRSRIWSLHVHTYCMLPQCRIETFPAFIMTRDWDRVMLGSPEEARAALQAAGLNYFLFSRELDIADPLPLSQLFSPDHIAEFLGIRWTDGATSLLTWRDSSTLPLDAAWLAAYRAAVDKSATVKSFPYAALQAIFVRLRATAHPWPPITLPWQARQP